MKLIDEQHTKFPVRFGQLKLKEYLEGKLNTEVNRKRIQRLMRLMNIQGDFEKKKMSVASKDHKIYPYLLTNLDISESNLVWSSDITYIPMRHGYMYLVAVIDWYSRYILSWELSNSMTSDFCRSALLSALKKGKPAIFNTDQGSQFTSEQYINILKRSEIEISMDGRGRWLDNVFIERFWRTIKYENIYKNSYDTVNELYDGIDRYIKYYNNKRIHQSLKYKTPKEVYFSN